MKRRVNIEIQKARSTRRQEEKSMNLELEKRWIITQQRQRHKSHIQAHLLLAVDISSPLILSWAIPCAFRSWSMHLLLSTLVSLPLPHALYFPCFGLLSRFELLAQFTVASVFDSIVQYCALCSSVVAVSFGQTEHPFNSPMAVHDHDAKLLSRSFTFAAPFEVK